MTQKPPRPPVRATYRHSDLRCVLLDIGTKLAHTGGPGTIVLHEATRRTGAAPSAAYHHFVGWLDLLQTMRAASLAALARAMEAEFGSIDPAWPADTQVRTSLRATGVGHLRLVRMKTGLFRTAFAISDEVENDVNPVKASNSGRNPPQLLDSVLDRTTAAGVLPAGRRPDTEYLAWFVTHGLALLIIDGLLHSHPLEQTGAITLRTVEMVESGL